MKNLMHAAILSATCAVTLAAQQPAPQPRQPGPPAGGPPAGEMRERMGPPEFGPPRGFPMMEYCRPHCWSGERR